MKLGLLVGRLNPPHIGHTSLIKKALSENDFVLVLLGSGKVLDQDNPLGFFERKKLLLEIFPQKELLIDEIKDISSDETWVQNIAKIVQRTISQNMDSGDILNIYGGDFESDSAILCFKKYAYFFGSLKVSYNLLDRFQQKIYYKGNEYDISATNLRQALRDGDLELAEQFCEKSVFDFVKNKIVVNS